MSIINPISGTNYSLLYDKSAVGGIKLSRNTREGCNHVADMSDEARIIAREIVNVRAAESARVTAEERYAAAKNFGIDFKKSLEGKGKIVRLSGAHKDTSSTTTSRHGTIVGISAHGTYAGGATSAIYTAQITRKDGFQLNLDLNEDVRINDHEDGSLTIFYAQSGSTKHYDKDGKESILEDAPKTLGTDGDDIIINVHGAHVDAGAGNDTILNFAHGATILGGDGDDEILMADYVRNVTINSGAGNDTIYLNSVELAKVTMDNGQDMLFGGKIRDSSIVSNSDNTIKAGDFHDSTLTSTTGKTRLDVGFSGGSIINLSDEGNIINLRATFHDQISTGNGDDTVNVGGSMGSTINTGGGNDTVYVNGGLSDATVNLGDGDDTMTVNGDIYKTAIHGGTGNDSITVDNVWFSSINAGPGQNSVHVRGDSWFSSLGKSATVDGDYRSIFSLQSHRFGSVEEDSVQPQMTPSELEAFWRASANDIADQFGGFQKIKNNGTQGTPLEVKAEDDEAVKNFKKGILDALGLGMKARPQQVVQAYIMQNLDI